MPTLARINATPLKGTALQSLERTPLTEAGIPGNRRFHLTDARGRLYSGLAHGPLVQVRATVDDGSLVCAFPDGATVAGSTEDLEDAVVTEFFGRLVPGHVVGGPFEAAFSAYVGAPVRLVRTDRDGDGPDVFPLTVVSHASVADLARRGDHDGALSPLRFRINLELADCEPFEEDTWAGRRVRLGTAELRIGDQIPRCAVTTQDPATGLHDWNTLKQIARFRPLTPDREVPFGMYVTVEQPGTVALGDRVALLEP